MKLETILKNRTVYLNGNWFNEEDAQVSVFDRGFLMADAVYEVTAVIDGKLIDFYGHAKRLERSLSELKMEAPVKIEELLAIHREIIARNKIKDGAVYLQITRGNSGDRDFNFPDKKAVAKTVILFTQAKENLRDNKMALKGIKVVSLPDLRWGRRDIKTVQLLYPSLAKMEAVSAGKDDAWLVQDGFVTEASASNAYIVIGKKIITRPLSNDVLHGITRASLKEFMKNSDFQIEERPFSIEEAKGADEAFVTSATNFVLPVVEIDSVKIGTGIPGPVSISLRNLYFVECLERSL